jgi:hypothetical protein
MGRIRQAPIGQIVKQTAKTKDFSFARKPGSLLFFWWQDIRQ